MARRLAWLSVLVVGTIAYIIVLRVMVATENVNFFPSLLLIGAATVPLAVLVQAHLGGRSRLLDTTTLLATAVAGGIVGTVVAGVLEYQTLRQLGTLKMLGVAVIEEAAKLIVPLAVVLLVKKAHDVRDGVVVGVASGAGFAVLETMGYGFQALLASRSVAAVDGTLLLRALLSPAGHVAWTGMTCAALWYWFGRRPHARGAALFAGAFALAVLMHALWDGSDVLVVHIGVVVISVGILLWLIHRSHRGLGTPTPTTTTTPAIPYLPAQEGPAHGGRG